MVVEMVQRAWEIMMLLSVAIVGKAAGSAVRYARADGETAAYCLSWRLAAEVNNLRPWRTVPAQCWRHVESYMVAGQHERDVELIVEQIVSYVGEIVPGGDGMDAWILDVDDTCLSNRIYYKGKGYGCEPYDPTGFRAWALTAGCPAVPGVLRVFRQLVATGFKVILLTGRDEETLGEATLHNLQIQGFFGYHRLIMRTAANKGQSAVAYKSEARTKLVEEGYRIWGNVGDQWSDIQGDCAGNRTFKIPNPMYFVP